MYSQTDYLLWNGPVQGPRKIPFRPSENSWSFVIRQQTNLGSSTGMAPALLASVSLHLVL